MRAPDGLYRSRTAAAITLLELPVVIATIAQACGDAPTSLETPPDATYWTTIG